MAISIAFFVSVFSIVIFAPWKVTGYTIHSPIIIDGDGDFTVANGVVSGSGMPSNPYVLEGWEIDASSAIGIDLRNTDAHFIIRDVYMHSGGRDYDGILLSNVENGRVERSILSDDSYGISIIDSRNITVSAASFSGNFRGLYLYSTVNVTVAYNDFSDNVDALQLDHSVRTVIICNNISNNGVGIYLRHSKDNVVIGNNVSGSSSYGFYNGYNVNTTVKGNRFVGDGIYLEGGSLSELNSHEITQDNLVNGLPIFYHKDCDGLNIDDVSVGQLIVANCTDISISNLTIMSTDAGIQIAYVSEGVVSANKLSGNLVGVLLAYSKDITIAASVTSESDWWGILSARSTDVTISANRVSFDKYGIFLGYTMNATIVANEVFHNENGIYLLQSSNTTIYHNNIADNVNQSYDDLGSQNFWDDGYPSGGNYWSDYSGIDQFSGPSQNQPSADGIGDTPYPIDADSQDDYPLMASINTPPIAYFTVNPAAGDSTTIFTADASASSDFQDSTAALEARWDWENDGVWDTAWSSIKVARHQYAEPGNYTIRLEVRDSGDLTSIATRTVAVGYRASGNDGTLVNWWIVALIMLIAILGVVIFALMKRKKHARNEHKKGDADTDG